MDELIFPSFPVIFPLLLLFPFNKPTLQPPVFGPSHRIKLTLSGALCFDVFKYLHSFDGLLRMPKYDIRKDSFFNCSPLHARRSLSRTLLCCKTSLKSLYEIWRFRYLKPFYAGRGRTNFDQLFRSKVPLRALFESCSAQCCVSVSAASPQPKKPKINLFQQFWKVVTSDPALKWESMCPLTFLQGLTSAYVLKYVVFSSVKWACSDPGLVLLVWFDVVYLHGSGSLPLLTKLLSSSADQVDGSGDSNNV